MDEEDGRMLRACLRADQRTRQLNVAVREADLLVSLDLDAPRDSWRLFAALPSQRADLTGRVALKLDAGLDRRRDRGARTGEEPVAIRRIQRPNLARFI